MEKSERNIFRAEITYHIFKSFAFLSFSCLALNSCKYSLTFPTKESLLEICYYCVPVWASPSSSTLSIQTTVTQPSPCILPCTTGTSLDGGLQVMHTILDNCSGLLIIRQCHTFKTRGIPALSREWWGVFMASALQPWLVLVRQTDLFVYLEKNGNTSTADHQSSNMTSHCVTTA